MAGILDCFGTVHVSRSVLLHVEADLQLVLRDRTGSLMRVAAKTRSCTCSFQLQLNSHLGFPLQASCQVLMTSEKSGRPGERTRSCVGISRRTERWALEQSAERGPRVLTS